MNSERVETFCSVLEPRIKVNVVAVCRTIGVSRRTVERWMAKGLVEWVRMPSGRRLIYADSILSVPERRTA